MLVIKLFEISHLAIIRLITFPITHYITVVLYTGPSAPLNVVLKSTTSTSIKVSWQKPKTTNGVITKYLIFYGQHKDNLESKFEAGGQNYEHDISGLKKFTSYYVQIRGKTTESGNASDVKSVKTLEDGKRSCAIVVLT